MRILLIETQDPRHLAELDLRYRVLRQPLGLPRMEPGTDLEQESLHLCALDGEDGAGEVIGCVLFRPATGTRGRLHQMAVDPHRQGRGLGRRLVAALEAELAGRGVEEVFLHARAPVVPFYERLGYTLDGDPFVEVGIPHRRMTKRLTLGR
jgi:ribosomal protein S18 acetylase RimI-like enzyme